MKTITLKLKNSGASLVCYIHENSGIIPSGDLRRGVLVIPGGSYEYCAVREADPVALSYVAKGFNAFVLSYSVGENAHWPMPLDDAIEAYALILANCEQWETDGEKIAAVGFSAGGHLAASLCLCQKHPAAMVLGYPCTDEPQCSSMTMLPPKIIGTATKACPPCFMFSTFEDALVPVCHTLDFARELVSLDVPVECHVFAHGEHGLSLAENYCANGKAFKIVPPVAQWFEMSVRWLYDLFGEYSANEQQYKFPTALEMGYCVDIVPQEMFLNPECLEILEKFYPQISQPERSWSVRKVPIRIFNSRLPSKVKLTDEQMEQLDSLLRQVKPA